VDNATPLDDYNPRIASLVLAGAACRRRLPVSKPTWSEVPAVSTIDANPTFARWALASAVRRHREQRLQTVEAFAELLGVAKTQASKLGNGSRGLSPDQVEALAESYDFGASERGRLLALAESAKGRSGWWQQRKLSENYRTLIGLEQAATSIREWCGDMIPGLLQHPDFAAAAIRAQALGMSDERIAEAAETRVLRQKILDGDHPLRLSVMFDEASLLRAPNRDVKAMRLQLQHLLDMAKRPDVTIRVLPFSRGVYPRFGTQMILLQLPEPVAPVRYAESPTGIAITDDPAEIAKAERHWEAMLPFAATAEATVDLVRKHLSALSG
jgi:transcriptional regulator with XRE-family HTH domain